MQILLNEWYGWTCGGCLYANLIRGPVLPGDETKCDRCGVAATITGIAPQQVRGDSQNRRVESESVPI